MSQPRFFADNDLNDYIVGGVQRRERAVKFLHCRDVELEAAPDAEVLAFAAANHMIVVSHDVSSMPAAAYERVANGLPMAGLFIAHQRDPIGPIIDNLLLIWVATEAEEWQDQVR